MNCAWIVQKPFIMPTFNKCPGGWRVQVRLAGVPSRSKTFPTKAQAIAWSNEIEAAVTDGRNGVVKATLEQVIERYTSEVSPTLKSGPNITKRLKALSKMLPVLRQVSEITAADLSRFRDKRMTEVSVATVRKEMTILRSVFESARRDWSMIATNPIADVKRPPAPPNRKRLMSDSERDRLLLALGFDGTVSTVSTVQHQVAVAMLLGLETAMRAGEMLGLTWDRVNLRGQYASLEKTKNGDYRDVPLSTRAVELLSLMQGVDKSTVFTLSLASLDALFRRARDRCEIDDLHFHDTRATALTNLSSKLDVMELARMVGHRDLKSLLVYYRKSATDLAQKLG